MKVTYALSFALFGAVVLFGCSRDQGNRTNAEEDQKPSPTTTAPGATTGESDRTEIDRTETERTMGGESDVERVSGSDRQTGGGASGSGSMSPSRVPPMGTQRDGGMMMQPQPQPQAEPQPQLQPPVEPQPQPQPPVEPPPQPGTGTGTSPQGGPGGSNPQ